MRMDELFGEDDITQMQRSQVACGLVANEIT